MLNVGIDTYIDLPYIDNFISSFGQNEVKFRWENLSDDFKEYYILYSMANLEGQKFIGKRMFRNQKTEFPRIPRDSTQSIDTEFESDDTNVGNIILVVPSYIKMAQAEILVSMLSIAGDDSTAAIQAKLKQGLVSFSLDGFSETYGGIQAESLEQLSPNAYILLKKWLRGSFSVL